MFGQPPTLTRRAARARLAALCAQFGFDLDPDLPASRMSIGQRQQLEIVRLLALGVRALILDEPTTGISAQQKERLFAALRRLAHEEGMSVLLVSHKLEDVIALCDEVIVLRAGRLVGSAVMPATTAELVRLMFEQELTPPLREDSVMDGVVFALNALTVHARRVRVEDFSLSVRAGEVIAFAGLDGSGQELIMRACVGLVRTDRGQILLGQQVMTHRPYRDFTRAGVVFSAAGRLEEGLIAGLTLTEHMALADGRGGWIDWPRARARTEAGIRAYHVRGRPEDRIEMLSGGNQQRWLMALLPAQPQVMILEQPTRGLDVDSSRWVWQQLLERRTHGTAIIFSSADLDELIAYSDRLVVFFAGRFHLLPDMRGVTVEQIGHLIGGNFEEARR